MVHRRCIVKLLKTIVMFQLCINVVVRLCTFNNRQCSIGRISTIDYMLSYTKTILFINKYCYTVLNIL